MSVLYDILHELLVFFRIEGLISIIKSGNLGSLKTIDGILAVLAPLAPLLIFAEILWLLVINGTNVKIYKIPFIIIILNRVVERLLSLSITVYFIQLCDDYAIIHIPFKWYWVPFAYLIYELNSYIRHYAAHKIRLLWCSHAVHHSSTELTSSVTLTTAYLENIYTDVFAACFCTLLGLPPMMFFLVMILDSIWGAFVHVSEKTIHNGRLGFLEKIILTPSHHRVHHARNFLYMDTNFCSIINIWDRIFGTYQEEKSDDPIQYGTTRVMDAHNFWDVYFGEYIDLWKDVKNAQGINKLLYVVMPPGWNPNQKLQTAKVLRKQALNNRK